MNNLDYKQFISPQYRSLSLFAKRKIKIKFRSISYQPHNQLNIFNMKGLIFQKDSLRRKSCYCNECGSLSKFQYKYMNLKHVPNMKKKIEISLRVEKRRQTKNSTFSKYRTIIFDQVRKTKVEQQQVESVEATPKESTGLKESIHKLKEYFQKQETQKKEIQMKARNFRYFVNKTPICSPNHYKSPRDKEFIPYLSYRRIELIHLKPLKFSDTLKSFQTHKKTLSTQS
ncbi:unnamed protein product [Paramecium primaurelia]|uniref:Uncharacterized protein n=1 Tax=Paramecium primaurelia TaxID=5886 RepID=A0A8S1QF50_PARPR|nr:unnamed protein product [Paramecium primaurelia]